MKVKTKKNHKNAFVVGQKLKTQFEKGEISADNFKDKFNRICYYLTDEEENEILAPYLLKIVNNINTGKEKTYSLEEILNLFR